MNIGMQPFRFSCVVTCRGYVTCSNVRTARSREENSFLPKRNGSFPPCQKCKDAFLCLSVNLPMQLCSAFHCLKKRNKTPIQHPQIKLRWIRSNDIHVCQGNWVWVLHLTNVDCFCDTFCTNTAFRKLHITMMAWQ